MLEEDSRLYLVKRHVVSLHTAQAIDERRQCDGAGSVAVAPHLGPRAREVAHTAARLHVQGNFQADGGTVVHIVHSLQNAAARFADGL